MRQLRIFIFAIRRTPHIDTLFSISDVSNLKQIIALQKLGEYTEALLV